jgi:hypothetical protein
MEYSRALSGKYPVIVNGRVADLHPETVRRSGLLSTLLNNPYSEESQRARTGQPFRIDITCPSGNGESTRPSPAVMSWVRRFFSDPDQAAPLCDKLKPEDIFCLLNFATYLDSEQLTAKVARCVAALTNEELGTLARLMKPINHRIYSDLRRVIDGRLSAEIVPYPKPHLSAEEYEEWERMYLLFPASLMTTALIQGCDVTEMMEQIVAEIEDDLKGSVMFSWRGALLPFLGDVAIGNSDDNPHHGGYFSLGTDGVYDWSVALMFTRDGSSMVPYGLLIVPTLDPFFYSTLVNNTRDRTVTRMLRPANVVVATSSAPGELTPSAGPRINLARFVVLHAADLASNAGSRDFYILAPFSVSGQNLYDSQVLLDRFAQDLGYDWRSLVHRARDFSKA